MATADAPEGLSMTPIDQGGIEPRWLDHAGYGSLGGDHGAVVNFQAFRNRRTLDDIEGSITTMVQDMAVVAECLDQLTHLPDGMLSGVSALRGNVGRLRSELGAFEDGTPVRDDARARARLADLGEKLTEIDRVLRLLEDRG